PPSAASRSTPKASSATTPSSTLERPFVRRAAPAGLPLVLRGRGLADDGRLDRARHQLLDHVPEVPLARPRRLRDHLALGAVPAFLDRLRRLRRSPRSAPADPARHRDLRGGL